GHAHVAVDPAPGDTARDVLDHAGRQEPAAVQGAAGSQRLVEGGHGAGGGVAAAARGARAPELGVVLVGPPDLAAAGGGRLVHVDGARVLRIGQAHVQL